MFILELHARGACDKRHVNPQEAALAYASEPKSSNSGPNHAQDGPARAAAYNLSHAPDVGKFKTVPAGD
jgi:hypothetical protein